MKYHFLASYLPELNRDDRKIRVGLADLLGERFHIAPEDWQEIELILLGQDITVLERLLSGKPVQVEHALYDVGFWRDQIKSPQDGPEFLQEYLRSLEPGTFSPKDADRLHSAYLDYVLSRSGSPLLQTYFEFDRDLRNVFSAVRARRKGRDPQDHLIGEGDFVDALGRSGAEDFGLGTDHPWIEKLGTARTPIEIQDLYDQLLWTHLEQHEDADPFAFDRLLSYLLKLQILERRLAMNDVAGMDMVKRLEAR